MRKPGVLLDDVQEVSNYVAALNHGLKRNRKIKHTVPGTPDAYVGFWDLEEEEGVTVVRIKELALELCEKADDVLLVPPSKRGRRPFFLTKIKLSG
jgi:hypothetical protein